MRRRTLLVAPLAALLPAGKSKSTAGKLKRAPRPRCRGILMHVRLPAGYRPTSWRDVPPTFEVIKLYRPEHSSLGDCWESLGVCRYIAKRANKAWLRRGADRWLIVIATDGRLARQTKGGAA